MATLTLPLVDDSDNMVRQEAAKVLARLVVHNNNSSDLPVVLDRIPSHRRAMFDDEVKKLSKDPKDPKDPLPPLPLTSSLSPGIMSELRTVPTPLSPPGRRASLKQRLHAVPVESPLSAQSEASQPSKSSTPPLAHKLATNGEALDEAAGVVCPSMETPLMKGMAEEIRSLHSKAGRLHEPETQTRRQARRGKLDVCCSIYILYAID